MSGALLYAFPKRYCLECPFKKIATDEEADLFGDYPFGDPERPMWCHFDGEFNALAEHPCKGFYTRARKLGIDFSAQIKEAP